MSDRDLRDAGLRPKIDCQQCLTEIPLDEAHSVEGDGYMLYFCGLECYDEWHRREEAQGAG
jgi:hypothetical protein